MHHVIPAIGRHIFKIEIRNGHQRVYTIPEVNIIGSFRVGLDNGYNLDKVPVKQEDPFRD